MSRVQTQVSRTDRSRPRGLAASLCVVCGALVFTAAGLNLVFLEHPQQQQQQEPLNREEIVPPSDGQAYSFVASDTANTRLVTGLIDPRDGDNHTDPALATTEECTEQFHLPVLRGVDVVAYWALPSGAEPVVGTPNLMSMFRGYRLFFSSIQNLRTFENDPVKYLPAWGGFCSYGVANETWWTNTTIGPFGNPAKWEILGRSGETRLHIFRSNVPMQRFNTDVDGFLERGEEVWRDWVGADVAKKGLGPLNTACFCDDSVCEDQ